MTAWGLVLDKRFLGHRKQHRSSSSPLQVILVDGEDEEELWKLCTRSISCRMIYSALVGGDLAKGLRGSTGVHAGFSHLISENRVGKDVAGNK